MEKVLFDAADRKQLKTWLDKDAVTVLTKAEAQKVDRARILPGRARVVRTNKAKPHQGLDPRSRIVVPGHLDQDLGTFRNDAPTAPQLSLFLALSVASSKKWKLSAFDVEAAFLNGVPLARELYCSLRADLAGSSPDELWKLEKAVFGLTEAPRYWWLRIRQDLLDVGYVEVPFLPATFLLHEGPKEDVLLRFADPARR